jgi:hypothetical protein
MEPIKSLALAIGMQVVRIASKMPVKPKMPVIGGETGGEPRYGDAVLEVISWFLGNPTQ